MAVTGLLALLDDVTALLDDVAVLSKAAATKTAGISGDDLAVNSHAVIGVDPKRELPVVWAVAKGSFINKLFLIPGALVLNFVAPAAIGPILVLGGIFLCYEGIEKVLHKPDAADEKNHHALTAAAIQSPEALMAFEQKKIKGAINTDLILSGEIVVISLGVVAAAPFMTQLAVLSAVGVGITVGIYGLVAGIVKLDDLGLAMANAKGDNLVARTVRASGNGLVRACPSIMKTIGIVGTAAMLMVGGGLVLHHGLPAVAHAISAFVGTITANGVAQAAIGMAVEAVAGVTAGLLAIPAVKVLAGPLGKCKQACKNLYARTLKKSPVAPPVQAPAPGLDISAPALQNAVDSQLGVSFNEISNTGPDFERGRFGLDGMKHGL